MRSGAWKWISRASLSMLYELQFSQQLPLSWAAMASGSWKASPLLLPPMTYVWWSVTIFQKFSPMVR